MITIRFPTGVTACAVEAPADARGEDVLDALDLPAPWGAVVLNGTTGELDPDLAVRLAPVLGALAARRPTILTGGTDAGIFSILGRAAAGDAPLVGVAPRHLVTWPGGPAGSGRVPLEPHHSHFVLVDGDEWGDETPALLEIAAALCRRAPCVVLICGGGPVTAAEALDHVRAGRPVVVVEGSGRFADVLAGAVRRRTDTGAMAEIARGEVTVCPLSSGPAGLVAAVLAYVQGGGG
ncbi:MAG: hypothetical protein M3326_12990 [Actinomycetota bacterium]|nr:hypothetical protein [Actinomycetota bacterium]